MHGTTTYYHLSCIIYWVKASWWTSIGISIVQATPCWIITAPQSILILKETVDKFTLLLLPPQGEKDRNIIDVHDFNLVIPTLEYHNRTWTWHDLLMAMKKDCTNVLVSQVRHSIKTRHLAPLWYYAHIPLEISDLKAFSLPWHL